MSGARAGDRPRPPVPPKSVFDDVIDDALKGATTAPASREPDDAPPDAPPAPAAPAQPPVRPRQRRAASRPDVPMPDELDTGTTKPLQVALPANLHWQLKLGSMTQALGMTEVVTALVTVFVEDPALVKRLMAAAADRGQTLGQLAHGMLEKLDRSG